MTIPGVSVIVPAYNRERYLGAALESALGQDHQPLEIIVVDDGSTDGTARVARSFTGVRYLYQSNQGAASARNAGIAASRGEHLAFLDSDDVWAPEKLRLQVDALRQHPGVGYCLTRLQNFLEPGCPVPSWIGPEQFSRAEFGIGTCTLMARREVFDRVGGFDPQYRWASDKDWFFRAKDARIALAILPEVLVHRRIHDGNLSASSEPSLLLLARMIKASVDRMRAQAGPAGIAGRAGAP
ncbi:MAG TPA: glycosyltransferase family A protein [Candidatus Methylomirabilis sp.]|nr:glycosyltransferase family A protein [Candidatus Methylomirabilis sp.]